MMKVKTNESAGKFRPDLILELAEAKDSEQQLTQPGMQNFVMEQLTCVPSQFKEAADEMLEILKTKQGLDIPAVKWMIAVGGVLVHAADAARGVNIYGSDFDDLAVMAKKSVTTCKFIYDL